MPKSPPSPSTSTPRKKSVQLPLEAAEVASRQLYHRGSSRPVQTLAWATAAGLASLRSLPSEVAGISRLEMDQDVWLNALFNDWSLLSGPWPKGEAKEGLSALQQVVISQRAILPPLPAFPSRPALTPPMLDKLWHHLDLAGWRMERFLTDPALEPHVDRSAQVFQLLQQGVDLLEQFQIMMVRPFSDHAVSACDYTEELAGILLRLHAALDHAAHAVGNDPLGWPVPDYAPFMGEPIALPKGTRGTALPETMAEDIQKALDARKCLRPLATVLPLLQRYADLMRALHPGWTWSPSRDGRECAFILFESGLEELPDWTPTQARELARLCTAAHAWTEGQPLPEFPSLTLDPTDDRAEALWLHQDLLFLVGSVLGVELGVIPEVEGMGALKRERRLRGQWAELQSMLWGAIFHWGPAPKENRAFLAEALPLAMGAVYQDFRNQIAKRDRAFLRFIPKPPENLAPRAKATLGRFGRVKKR